MSDLDPRGGPVDRSRGDVPLWRQALFGISMVTLGGLLALGVGLLMAVVVSWLF